MTQTLTAEHRFRALHSCPVFASVAVEDLRLLAEIARTEQLGPDEILFEAGEPAQEIFVVASGSLEVFVPEHSAPCNALHPGDLFGEYAMFYNNVRTTTVRSVTPACLLSIDYRRFRAYLLRFPEMSLKLLGIAIRRLVTLERTH
jgi:CRP-like cAMP-binding protein